MFHWSYLAYLTLFAGVFAMQLGVFDLFGFGTNDDDTGGNGNGGGGGDDGPDAFARLDYDPDDYSRTLVGTVGDDTAYAGAGDDRLAWFLDAGADRLVATDGNDYAEGGDGADDLTLRGGDDQVAAGAGDDRVLAGEGDDIVHGQDGDDTILGHGGADRLYGGHGDDRIEGGYGDDTIFGGTGNDTLSGDTLTQPGNMGRGIDVIDGGAGDDNIFLGDGDTGTGGAGDDTFTVFEIDNPDAPPARITDFDPAKDALHIQHTPVTDPDTGAAVDPVVEVSYDADDDVTTVRLNGTAVATLDGDAGITKDDITLGRIE